MTYSMKRTAILFAFAAPLLLAGCGVSQEDYDALKAQNAQLQQQVATSNAEITRLQEAVQYTVNSDLLFPSGGWQVSDRGKQIIANLAKKLAPSQKNHIYISGYTDDEPIGSTLMRQGITSNQMLSQKRADSVRNFIISQGVNQDLVSAKGFGEADPAASNATPAGRTQNRRVVLSLAPPAG